MINRKLKIEVKRYKSAHYIANDKLHMKINIKTVKCLCTAASIQKNGHYVPLIYYLLSDKSIKVYLAFVSKKYSIIFVLLQVNNLKQLFLLRIRETYLLTCKKNCAVGQSVI